MNGKKMTLKTKLIGGFATVLGLMLVVAAVGYNALHGASEGYEEYREMARDSNLSGRLQANMLIVRMSVKDYLINGNRSALDRFNERWEMMARFQERAQNEIQAPERAKTIDEIGDALDRYKTGFQQIIELRDTRNELVNGILDVKGPVMENALTDIMISANEDGDTTVSYYTGLAMKHLLLARLYMVKFLDTNDRGAVDRVYREFEKMADNLEILDTQLQNPTRRELLDTVKEARQIYQNAFDRLTATIFDQNRIVSGTLDRIGPEIAGKIETVKLDIKNVQDTIGPRLQSSNRNAVSLILAVSAAAVCIGATLVFFIIRGVMNQLGSDPADIARITESIARGNLSVEFDRKNGDIRGVYAGMKHMTENLSEMLKDITSGIETLNASSTELAGVSEQMAAGAAGTSERSGSVATAAEEMSTNMDNVAAATEQTSGNIRMIVASAEEMSATIQEIADNTARGNETTSGAVEKAKEVSGKVDELGKAAEDISKVTETISDISEQTNLLALNATIEAARAGEAGKGFTVVAGEIKALAQQTADATRDIGEKIKGVQETTSESVTAIESIVEVINEINEIVSTVATAVEEQSATTAEISNNVSQAAEGVQEVNENVNQTSEVAREVTEDITRVNQSAEEMNTGSQKVNESARELSRLSEKLDTIASRFTV